MLIKKQGEYKALYNAALVTSPIIALLLVTPVLLTTYLSTFHFGIVYPLVSFFIFISWLLHIAIIKKTVYKRKWQRFVLASSIIITVSTIVYYSFIRNFLPALGWSFQLLRILNIISINGIIFIISNYILLNQTKKKLDVENEQLKFANLEARYQTLKNQINPHFLFNSIGTAKALIRKNPMIADEYLVKLSDFLRLGFDNKTDIITVKEEVLLCKDYIALQQMRFGNALQIDAAIDEKYMDYYVPHFSMLSLIENAVKHNNMTDDDPMIIHIKNNNEWLTVENNINERVLLEASNKTGLANLTERYRLLFDEAVLIENNAIVFRVTIKMMQR
jgi:sensor histidine kinase YesM